MEQPDCKNCGFANGDMCVVPGIKNMKQSEVNTTSKATLFSGEEYDRPDCELFCKADAAEIIRLKGYMDCRNCKHYDSVRGFHVCFSEEYPLEPYNPCGVPDFSVDLKVVKSTYYDNGDFGVCLDYEVKNGK